VYLDLVSLSALAVQYGYDFAGPDRLLFGTDHPWVKVETMLDLLRTMDVPRDDLARMLGLNAAKPFRI